MVKEFKVNGKIVDRMNANLKVINKIQRNKLNVAKYDEPDSRFVEVPDEFTTIKNFAKDNRTINKKKEEFYFDLTDDGKPMNIKKESRIDKMRKPFTIRNGKKYYGKFHSV
tara:strand:+ start:491 stop:823 length:333 start_codon:yes stop_codon:yes gene_type:complete